jgi:NAD(P)-dependent dehydrogenase (short-subunit alcohol dehydrogenase family)
MKNLEFFKDRICLVTGSSRGIGLAVAKALAVQGARVILHGRDERRLEEHVIMLPDPSRHGFICADLNLQDEIDKLVIEVGKRCLKLDVIIHCAGVLGPRSLLEDYPLQDWEQVIRVNLTAPFLITQKLLPLIRKAEHPTVIFVSSGVGVRGSANWGAYSVSKFGIEGLTQVWADELRDEKIRVKAINPGRTRTRMRAQAYPDEDPLTLPTPEDIAPVFLKMLDPKIQ